MKPVFAIVEAGDAGVSGVLAGEALRRAAQGLGQPIEIELRTAQGVINPIEPGEGDALLFVAPDGVHDPLVEARAYRRLSLEAVLADPKGALFLSGEGALLAHLAAGELASTVGAGDAMVAGLAAAILEGADLERLARLSTAFAVAKLGRPGPHLPNVTTVHALSEDVTISLAGATGEV